MRILVVDDDPGVCETFDIALRAAGHTVSTAQTGQEGMAFGLGAFDAAWIDLRLPDVSGLIVLRQFLERNPTSAAFLMTGFATVDSAIDAMKIGATDYFHKPLYIDIVLETLTHLPTPRRLPTPPPAATATVTVPPMAQWAALVIRGLADPTDPKTVDNWSRFVGVSRGALENRCLRVRIHAKASLDILRLLRCLLRSQRTGCTPELYLDGDPRTVGRLTSLAGQWPPSDVDSLIDQQHVISNDLARLALKRALQQRLGMRGPESAHDDGTESI